MSIIARASNPGGDSFVPAPVGLHRAVCCDVVDLGLVAGQFGTKHKVQLVWQCEATMADGKPYMVSQRYTLSLDERANLRRDLESWRGKPFSLTEAAGFDLERLVTKLCGLVIVHKPGRDNTKVFANVASIVPCPPGKPLTVRDYTRVTQRPGYQPPPGQHPHPSVGPSYPTQHASETERAVQNTRPLKWPGQSSTEPPATMLPPQPPADVFDADPFGEAKAVQAPPIISHEDIPF